MQKLRKCLLQATHPSRSGWVGMLVLASGCYTQSAHSQGSLQAAKGPAKAFSPAESPTRTFFVRNPPPEPLRESMTVQPGPGYVWIEGNWHWRPHHWTWHSGRWVRDRPGYVFVHPYYDYVRGRYLYRRGYWVAHERLPRAYMVCTSKARGRPRTFYQQPVHYRPRRRHRPCGNRR